MTKNYYEAKTDRVSSLLHFPFEDFSKFKDAAKADEIKVAIADDIARQWVSTGEYSKFYGTLVTLLLLGYFIPSLAILIGAIFVGNFWYLILVPVALFLGLTTFSPIAGRIGGNSLLFIYFGIIITLAFVLPNGVATLAWLPIVIGFLCVRYGYKLAHKITMNQIFFNESLLCRLWKFGHLRIQDAKGVAYSQRYLEKGEEHKTYSDIDRLWKEYIDNNNGLNDENDVATNRTKDELEDWDTIKNR